MYHCTETQETRTKGQLTITHANCKVCSVVMSTFANVACGVLQHRTAEFGHIYMAHALMFTMPRMLTSWAKSRWFSAISPR